MTVLGNRIRRLRKEAKLTQAQLGKLLDCSGSTISLYEGGQRSPDTLMLVRLADVFEVSVDYLLGRDTPSDYRPKNLPYISSSEPSIVTEELAPEAVEFLKIMTKEIKKHFPKEDSQYNKRKGQDSGIKPET